MSANRIIVSDDGRELTIISPGGQRATWRSTRTEGFSQADIATARLSPRMLNGQVNRVWRVCRYGGRGVYLHVNTGPPTWWRPRIELGRNKAVIGWLQVLVALSWDSAVEQRKW